MWIGLKQRNRGVKRGCEIEQDLLIYAFLWIPTRALETFYEEGQVYGTVNSVRANLFSAFSFSRQIVTGSFVPDDIRHSCWQWHIGYWHSNGQMRR